MRTVIAVAVVTAFAASAGAQMMPRGELVFQEAFSDNRNEWAVGGFGDVVADSLIQRKFEFHEGEYRATSHEWGARAWCTQCGTYGDASYELIARFKEGGDDAFYGIVFRVNPNNTDEFYLFEVYAEGAYSFWRHSSGGNWDGIIPRTDHEIVTVGKGTNILGVVASGSHFDLYVNNTLVDSADDDHYTEGWVGVYVETGAGNTGTASFDAMRIYELP
jgi:hypothetical protein